MRKRLKDGNFCFVAGIWSDNGWARPYFHYETILKCVAISGALIVRYSKNKQCISFVFYCFDNLSIAQNFGTTGPIQVFSKMYLSN